VTGNVVDGARHGLRFVDCKDYTHTGNILRNLTDVPVIGGSE
jgi:hypothetical protein